MRIGIDISQVAFEGTGVARYVRELVSNLIRVDPQYEYTLFGSSLRRKKTLFSFAHKMQRISPKVTVKIVSIPPTVLHILWNIIHIVPITTFTGFLDVFWSSDWTQPPLGKVLGMTTIHDVSFLKYPESFPGIITTVQKYRLRWAKRECAVFLCDSEATKTDVIQKLLIPEEKLFVVYPGRM